MKGEPFWLPDEPFDFELLSEDSLRGMEAAQKLEAVGEDICRWIPPLLRRGTGIPPSGRTMFHFAAKEWMISMQRAAN